MLDLRVEVEADEEHEGEAEVACGVVVGVGVGWWRGVWGVSTAESSALREWKGGRRTEEGAGVPLHVGALRVVLHGLEGGLVGGWERGSWARQTRGRREGQFGMRLAGPQAAELLVHGRAGRSAP